MAGSEKKIRLTLPVLPAPGPLAAGAEGAGSLASLGGARIGVVTLGCDKNTVDSERILGRLAGAGLAAGSGAADADVVVINTCGFIEPAKEESIEAILEAVRLKEEGRIRAVVAMGCLVERYKSELEAELPEVDLFLGLGEVDRLLPELEAMGLGAPGDPIPTMERPLRVLSTSTNHTSFLKISEGCDHGCAFCAIPLMRGRHRSSPIEELVREAAELEAAGVVELNIISQDTTWYGRDWRGGGEDWRRGALPVLLRALLDETDIPWFRLFYMYPSGITRELVELIAREPRLLPYLDMPIQHGSDTVLRRMRRPERQATIRERVGWLRDAIPDLALRTTVILGFPGETEEEFEELLELLEEIRFDHLGAFSYSREEGTRAAEMDGQVPESVRRERLERVLDLQRSIALEKNEAMIGRRFEVLIDRVESDGEAFGRTMGQALDVDGVTRITGARGLSPGEFVPVLITGAHEDELTGEVQVEQYVA